MVSSFFCYPKLSRCDQPVFPFLQAQRINDTIYWVHEQICVLSFIPSRVGGCSLVETAGIIFRTLSNVAHSVGKLPVQIIVVDVSPAVSDTPNYGPGCLEVPRFYAGLWRSFVSLPRPPPGETTFHIFVLPTGWCVYVATDHGCIFLTACKTSRKPRQLILWIRAEYPPAAQDEFPLLVKPGLYI